jgi:hypothetical protein
MARRGTAWAAGLAFAGAALGSAWLPVGAVAYAQDAAAAKPRRPAPPVATPAPDTAPLTGPYIAGAQVAPLPGAGLLRVGPPVSSAPALRSAVRSQWSAPASIASRGGGECRAQCAETRVACLAPVSDDDAPRCNEGWTSCLSTCAGLTYGRAPPTP